MAFKFRNNKNFIFSQCIGMLCTKFQISSSKTVIGSLRTDEHTHTPIHTRIKATRDDALRIELTVDHGIVAGLSPRDCNLIRAPQQL